jgi:GATA-binding protein
MKKTVIKRRKRVPAVGTTSRNSPGVPSQSEQNSPARSSVPVPPTATASGGAYPTPTESEKSHPSPYGAPPSLHETRSPSIFDPIGIRRQQQAVPLNLSGSAGGERKKPWWFDDRTPHQAKEAEPKDTKDQGVSHLPCTILTEVITSFVNVSGDPHCSTEFQDPLLAPLMFSTRLPPLIILVIC